MNVNYVELNGIKHPYFNGALWRQIAYIRDAKWNDWDEANKGLQDLQNQIAIFKVFPNYAEIQKHEI